MPVLMPTPDELLLMPWHKRDKVLAQARALLAAYGDAYVPAKPSRHRMTDAQRARSKRARRKRAAAWGEQVRAEARRLESEGWGA